MIFQRHQQILLTEEFRKLVTITTHNGLFSYTRLPYGITSAPAIFHNIMCNNIKQTLTTASVTVCRLRSPRLALIQQKREWILKKQNLGTSLTIKKAPRGLPQPNYLPLSSPQISKPKNTKCRVAIWRNTKQEIN